MRWYCPNSPQLPLTEYGRRLIGWAGNNNQHTWKKGRAAERQQQKLLSASIKKARNKQKQLLEKGYTQRRRQPKKTIAEKAAIPERKQPPRTTPNSVLKEAAKTNCPVCRDSSKGHPGPWMKWMPQHSPAAFPSYKLSPQLPAQLALSG